MAAAEATGQRQAPATFLIDLGATLAHSPAMSEAPAYLDRAVEYYESVGDWQGQGEAIYNRGDAYEELYGQAEALADFQQALACYRTAGDRGGQANCWSRLGHWYNKSEEADQALTCFEQALSDFQAVGDLTGAARTCNDLGLAYQNRGDFARNIEYLTRSRDLGREAGSAWAEQIAILNLAGARTNAGDLDGGIAELQAGLLLADANGWELAEIYRRTLEQWLARRRDEQP